VTVESNPGAAGNPQVREFRAGDELWCVTAGGEGVAGSDALAERAVQVFRFARAAEPDRPVVEALTRCLDPYDLFDEELAAILESGIRIVEDDRGISPSDPPARPGDHMPAQSAGDSTDG
jgi:hypothetical protein